MMTSNRNNIAVIHELFGASTTIFVLHIFSVFNECYAPVVGGMEGR